MNYDQQVAKQIALLKKYNLTVHISKKGKVTFRRKHER